MSESDNDCVNYGMGTVIHGEGVVSSLDFHREGQWLAMGTSEGSIHIIDSLSGEEKKKLYAKTDGAANVKFTHHEACVLFSSEMNNNQIKYLCTYDNRYIRYFEGHRGKVNSITMSPIDDNFISSDDKTIRLWNLAAPNVIAKINLPPSCSNPSVQYDESGLVFGVLCFDSYLNRHNLKLFDARNYENGPFQDILPDNKMIEKAILNSNSTLSSSQIQKYLTCDWDSFEFSTDGNHILVNTKSDLFLVLDGFRNEVEPLAITNRKNDGFLSLGCGFSPDAKNIVTANDENEVLIYDYKKGLESLSMSTFDQNNSNMDIVTPEGGTQVGGMLKSVLTGHVSQVGCVKCNPKYNVFATGCVNTVLWVPGTPIVESDSESQ